MPPFAPGLTISVIISEDGVVVDVDSEKPVLRVINNSDAPVFALVGVDLDKPPSPRAGRKNATVEPGMPVMPRIATLILKGTGANKLVLIGRDGSQVFVTAGEVR